MKILQRPLAIDLHRWVFTTLQLGVVISLYGVCPESYAMRAPATTVDDLSQLSSPSFHELFDEPGFTTIHVDESLTQFLDMINRGDYDTAIPGIRKAIQQTPRSAPAHELLGIALVKTDQIDEGLESLKKAVELDPNQHTAITKIGDVYLAQKKFEDAKLQFIAALEKKPGERIPHQRLGLIYEREGHFDDAIEHFEQGLVGTPPNYVGVKANLGRLYNHKRKYKKTLKLMAGLIDESNLSPLAGIVVGTAQLGENQVDQAIETLKRTATLHDTHVPSQIALGIGLRQAKDYDASLAAFEKAIEIDPDTYLGYVQMGETYHTMGKLDDAILSFEKAESRSPNPTAIRKRIAKSYLDAKQSSEAIQIYEDLIASDQADLQVYDILATCYQLEEQFEDAERLLRRACTTFPKHPFPYYRLGIFFAYIKDYKKALIPLDKAQSLQPKDPTILKALSLAHSRSGNQDKAVEIAREICELRPENVGDRFYLATAHLQAGDTARAITVYRNILDLDDTHALSLNNLAYLLAEDGKVAEALPLSEKAVSLYPENALLLDTNGWVLFKLGQVEKAMEILKRAIALSPNNPTIRFHMGMVYFESDRKEEALVELNLALSLSESFSEYKKCKEVRDLLVLENQSTP